MPVEYKRTVIGDGIGLSVIKDKKFKTNSVAIRFIDELCESKAAANSLISGVLVSSNEKYPSKKELSKALSSLYGADIISSKSKIANGQIITIGVSCIRDDYAIYGETITSETVRLLLDCIFRPVIEDGGFAKKEFEIRKRELVEDIEALINDKRGYAVDKTLKTAFEGENFAVDVNGTVESVSALDTVGVYKRYKELLKTAAIEITFAGGGDFDEAIALVTDAFASIERNYNDKWSFYDKSPLKPELRKVTEQLDVNQSKMVMVYKGGSDDLYVNKFTSAILGGTAFSKLFTNVREKMSLCYYCAARIIDGKGALVIDSGVDRKNVGLAKEAINKELEKIAQGEITDEEIANTKLVMCGNNRSTYDYVNALSSWYFTMFLRGEIYSYEQMMEKINSITKEEIINCAESYKLDTVYLLENSDKGGNE